MSDTEEVRRFLQQVWKSQGQDGYAFISYKDEEGWHDCPIEHWRKRFQLPNDGEDLYFCPNLFDRPRRLAKHALPSVWLYADLDEVDPDTEDFSPPPSAAWQTSPGRYQCLWELFQHVRPDTHKKLNSRLTYFTGADKGGWSITKVLRVPGTHSYKYDPPVPVKLLWDGMQRYSSSYLWHDILRHVPGPDEVQDAKLVLPERSADLILRDHELSASTRKLLKAKNTGGADRSALLWKLECKLLSEGLSPEETLVVVRGTVWNKYAGQRREESQLWREITKARGHVAKRKEEKGHDAGDAQERPRTKGLLPVEDFAQFVTKRFRAPAWLVEGIWGGEAHGLLAGEEKSFKSTIALDLAVSVASGTMFMDRFPVPTKGPVLYVQEENPGHHMQNLMRRIGHSRGIGQHVSYANGNITLHNNSMDLPLYLVSETGFKLSDDEDIKKLARTIKTLRPALVVLDPFYMMVEGVNENSQADVAPIMQRLLWLKQKFNTGILLVHHYKKQNLEFPTHGSQRVSGTGVFGRWFESALFLERTDKYNTVKLTGHHRTAPPPDPMTLEFRMDPDDLDYHVEIVSSGSGNEAVVEKLATIVDAAPKTPIREIAKILGMSPATVEKLGREELDYGVGKGAASTSGGRRPKVFVP